MERCETKNHLHFWMVCWARTKSARSFGILVHKYMGWYEQKNKNLAGKVMCKVLTNCMLHTYQGMIAYCLKDVGKNHFEHCMFNVSNDDVNAGQNLHPLYGRVDIKSRVTLSNKKITERMYV